jgi:hypothetical protein
VSVHKVGYFADRLCIFSPNGCENAFLRKFVHNVSTLWTNSNYFEKLICYIFAVLLHNCITHNVPGVWIGYRLRGNIKACKDTVLHLQIYLKIHIRF